MVVLDGADFVPAQVAPFLDIGMKIVFVVNGDAPAAAMSRLVTPGVFVQQVAGENGLEAFAAFEGTAAAALLPEGAVSFVHDPGAGEATFERFTTLEFPRELRKRSIGGISFAQQAEDYALLEALSVVPGPSGDAAADAPGADGVPDRAADADGGGSHEVSVHRAEGSGDDAIVDVVEQHRRAVESISHRCPSDLREAAGAAAARAVEAP